MKKSLYKFLGIHFIVWSLIPLLRGSLPMDSIEAVVWGQIGGLGTNKHPPLSGFFADLFYRITCGTDIGIYLLSQLFILGGFFYIFRLAKLFLDEKKAILAVMLLEGVIYYGFTSAEYNVNVISLLLWPMASFYFCRAILKDTPVDWLWFGLAASLNLWNKYVGGLLLFTAALYLLLTRKGRTQLKKPMLYAGAAFALILIAPHVYWLYQHDFFVLSYFFGRSGSSGGWLGHLLNPLKFAAAQLVAGLLALVVFFWAYAKAKKTKSVMTHQQNQLLFYLGILPFILFTAIALFSGIHLKSMWGTPLLYMLGILLFARFNFTVTDKLFSQIIRNVYIAMGLLGFSAALIYALNKSEKMHFPRAEFAEGVMQNWKSQTRNAPLPYTGGEIWYAANLSLSSADHPYVILDTNLKNNPWVKDKDLYAKGAVIFLGKDQDYNEAHQKYLAASPLFTQDIICKNRLGQKKKKQVRYFIIYPEGEY